MGIGGYGWRRSLEFAQQFDLVYFQVIVAQGQSFVQYLTDIDVFFLRLALTRERQQALHHAMGTLRLLEELADKVGRVVAEPLAFEKLRISENRGQRIVSSWATPAINCPTADIFSLCSNCSCVLRRSS